jgi:hypothetical protein
MYAQENPCGEGELGFHRAAGRAGLRTGIPAAGYHELSAVPGGLVAELAAQLAGTGVGQGTVQAPPACAGAGLAPHHPGHIQTVISDGLC